MTQRKRVLYLCALCPDLPSSHPPTTQTQTRPARHLPPHSTRSGPAPRGRHVYSPELPPATVGAVARAPPDPRACGLEARQRAGA